MELKQKNFVKESKKPFTAINSPRPRPPLLKKKKKRKVPATKY